jgi:SulP family sulfate permease
MIMFLGAVESILSALATDKMIRDRHDSDQELIAQGVANCVVPWFGGIPVTGAIARSSTNVQSGGRSPVAGLVHAVILAVIVLLASPLVTYIPMAILAVILMHVACKMFEYHHFLELRKVTHGELAMAIVTFVLTVSVDLTWGVGFGMGVGAVLLILRMREITTLRVVTPSTDRTMGPESLRNRSVPMEMMFFRMEGVFFYAVADDLPLRIEIALAKAPATRIIVLRMGKLLSLDFHGLLVLDELLASLRKRGIHLLICDVQPHPATMLNKHGFLDELGLENLCGNLEITMVRAENILKRQNQGLV